MFGGAGIYRDDVMFALVSDGEVFLKADDKTAPDFKAAGSRPFVYDKDGKSVTMSYWSMPDDAADDAELLKTWADLAFRTALQKAKPKKKR
jgi:DNA transformation protein